MPYYQLEWQKIEEVKGRKTTINYAKTIIINDKEKNPDKIAREEAEKIFKKLPESVFTATLKKVVALLQKEFTKP